MRKRRSRKHLIAGQTQWAASPNTRSMSWPRRFQTTRPLVERRLGGNRWWSHFFQTYWTSWQKVPWGEIKTGRMAAMKRKEFGISDHNYLAMQDFKWWVSSVKSFLNTKASKNSSQQATKSSYSRRRHPTDPSNKYGKQGSVQISTRLRVYLTQSIRFWLIRLTIYLQSIPLDVAGFYSE